MAGIGRGKNDTGKIDARRERWGCVKYKVTNVNNFFKKFP